MHANGNGRDDYYTLVMKIEAWFIKYWAHAYTQEYKLTDRSVGLKTFENNP